MKFQNPSLKFFLKGRTDTRTHKPKPICSPLFQNWGHNDVLKDSFYFRNGYYKCKDNCELLYWLYQNISTNDNSAFGYMVRLQLKT